MKVGGKTLKVSIKLNKKVVAAMTVSEKDMVGLEKCPSSQTILVGCHDTWRRNYV